MSRPVLTPLAAPSAVLLGVLLACGCRAQPEGPTGQVVDSAEASIAGTESKPAERSPIGPIREGAGLGNSLVAVATTNPGDAQPCERTCGRIGDCLLADEDYEAVAAGGLELQCLDLCVHSPDDAAAKAEFLACGETDDCGRITTCAEQRWAALAETSRAPEIEGVTASADPCKSGCRWMYACSFAGKPPGEAHLDPQLEASMQVCIDNCDQLINEQEREMFRKLAECLPSHCSFEHAAECWEYLY